MSFNLSNPEPTQPLSLGNVVSAGLRLYRSHLKSYLELSFIGYAWILVPIYGWAKCPATLVSISRLAFGELVNQPESIQDAKRILSSRMWQFLLLGLLTFLLTFGLFFVILIVFSIVLGIIIGGIQVSGVVNFSSSNLATNPIFFGFVLIFEIILFLWIQARFLIVEVPLAVEDSITVTSAIGRSWNLTKGNVWRIVSILFIAYLITIPMQLPFSLLSNLIQIFIAYVAKESPFYLFISYFTSFVMFLISLAIFTPFWQAIKAVIYYDLRSRREGFGLRLHDRKV